MSGPDGKSSVRVRVIPGQGAGDFIVSFDPPATEGGSPAKLLDYTPPSSKVTVPSGDRMPRGATPLLEAVIKGLFAYHPPPTKLEVYSGWAYVYTAATRTDVSRLMVQAARQAGYDPIQN